MVIMIKKYFKNNIKIIILLKHGWTKNNFETTIINCGSKENCKIIVTNGGFKDIYETFKTTVTNGGFTYLKKKIHVDVYVDAKRLVWQIFWDGYYSCHFFSTNGLYWT